MSARRLCGGVAAAALLTACAGTPGPSATEPASPQSSSTPPQASPSAPARGPGLVVVGRFTDRPLRLTGAQAARIREREPARWRGQRVSVVPLEQVGPAQVVARVDGRDPVRADPRAVTVTVVGDVMLVRGVPDARQALAPMSRRLRSADLTVGNLESTLSLDGSPTQGGDSFGSGPELLGPLQRAGFDVLSLANNHTWDYGDQALVQTVRTLRESPIVPFGAGADRAEAERPAILERDGVRFGFVGFNAIGETPRALPGALGAVSVRMPPRTGPLQQADLDRFTRLVRRTAERVDVVVALPHWGTQYTHVPEPVQRRVGRAVVRAGADLVVGGHPHWVQGIDSVGGTPLLHSLGNFVFDMDFSTQTMEGVVLETTWWGPGDGAELKAMRLVPYMMDPTSFAPRVVRGEEAARILDDVASTSSGPYAD